MSCETETAGVLRGAGQKVTPQRMLILAALRHHHTHATASALLEEVRHSYPFLDISTVYRTLASARDLKLVSELTRSGADAEYEWIGNEPHHHLICRVCGQESVLDNGHVETLAASLLAADGFQADLEHFAIVGVCRKCTAAVNPGASGR
jgi:Fur family ferric uptake transcriptional regulator